MKLRGPANPGAVSVWLQQDREPGARAICPPRDSPFRLHHRIGHRLLNPQLLTAEALHNALNWYLLPRLKVGTGPATALFSWLMLSLGELWLLWLAWTWGEKAFLMVAGFAELAILPFFICLILQRAMAGAVTGFLGKVSCDQLFATRIEPRDVPSALLARQMIIQSFSLFVTSVLLAAGLAALIAAERLQKGIVPDIGVLGMIVFVFLRHYSLRVFIEYAMLTALRAALQHRRPGEVFARMSEQAFWPWTALNFFLPGALTFVTALAYLHNETALFFGSLLATMMTAMLVPAHASNANVRVWREVRDEPGKWWIFAEDGSPR